MSLRDVFLSQVRDRLYATLKGTILRDWRPEIVANLANETMEEKTYEINSYIQNNVITLESITHHAQRIVDSILVPYVYKKRVE
jgi:hypothetical protein